MQIYPLELGLQEDCPYADITTELLRIEGQGRLRFITREEAVVTGTFRLKDFFESKVRGSILPKVWRFNNSGGYNHRGNW
jgi:nicotinate-nucleotide pyrophosphorylase